MAPLAAQDVSGRVVLYGRFEDAVSREPIEGVGVLAADTLAAAYSDSLGTFVIALPRDGPFRVFTQRFGYQTQRFDLDEAVRVRSVVLLLEPAPLEIEGLTVVEEAALTTLRRNLESRRNAFPHAMVALDRGSLD